MGSKYNSEVLAIQQLRRLRPDLPARTLARCIGICDFTEEKFRILAVNAIAGGRSFFSVYSVIRRYDRAHQGKLAA